MSEPTNNRRRRAYGSTSLPSEPMSTCKWWNPVSWYTHWQWKRALRKDIRRWASTGWALGSYRAQLDNKRNSKEY